ncbi:MAG TPA: histidine kinase dimerization/phosphoacceptor domain -containing protein [Candidatus Omnitrophota bacterium]|nr:histidine kinase dimerization/phosphoacceptor domain -containing protein [Candidatus Omnitrophota bacterium]
MGIVAAFAALTWSDHVSTRRGAEAGLMEVARLMEEHTRSAMLSGSIQLNRVADLIGDRPLSALQGSETDWAALRRIMDDFPNSDSLWVFDPAANLVLSTLKPAGVTLNVADREYFTAVHGGARLFISPMIWGKLYGGYYFAMSRPVDNPDGSLRGVVQFSIKTSYFSSFYRNLSPEDGASFTIFKDDATLVARYPEPPAGSHETVAKPTILQDHLAEADLGTYQVRSTFDGIERIYAYRRVSGHPLVVATGLPTKVVFKPWLDRTLRNGALAAATLGAFLLIAWQLSRAFRREELERAKAQALLADRDVLFQEIHHRVKNNLQIISSFLTMQAIKAGNAATAESFQQALDRIHSMGLVHQTLYEQKEAAEVSMDAYLRALAASVGQSYGAVGREIEISVRTDGTRLNLDRAVPLALLANEALTNALKHAFPTASGGHIEMSLFAEGGRLSFAVKDDGVGMAAGGSGGLGMHILNALARQLEGDLATTVDGGTRLQVTFPA